MSANQFIEIELASGARTILNKSSIFGVNDHDGKAKVSLSMTDEGQVLNEDYEDFLKRLGVDRVK